MPGERERPCPVSATHAAPGRLQPKGLSVGLPRRAGSRPGCAAAGRLLLVFAARTRALQSIE